MTRPGSRWGIGHLSVLLAAGFLVLASASGAGAAGTIRAAADWKNTIDFPFDPFRADASTIFDPAWIKFTILKNQPDTVYFQDSRAYKFHYPFAVKNLEPFAGMSEREFDNLTLYAQGQVAILGAVIFPPSLNNPTTETQRAEYGIQLVRQDPYSAEEIVSLFNLVRSKVEATSATRAFYFPAYEQIAEAQRNRVWLESQGVPVSGPDRWAQDNAVYASGWAFGRLKYCAGEAIDRAFSRGELLATDILLTDGVPAEIPILAGVLTLTPSTPNSHVAILSQTYGTPFAHLALEQDAAQAQSLIGRRVAVNASGSNSGWAVPKVRLFDLETELNDVLTSEILALKDPPILEFQPMQLFGAFSASTDNLTPDDIVFFGGKAANFGALRRSIPQNAPVSLAFSFDLWNAFLDQSLSTGRTLRAEIQVRLSKYTTYPVSDIQSLQDDLKGIRDLFKDDRVTTFTETCSQAVLTALQDPRYGLDPLKKIRFRSSTNVEDSKNFTGAGLYSSYSGCLADDLDGDNQGPSQADPNWLEERGVFYTIRRVFASFYNENAFLARLRHRVDESKVGMALLVHPSTPDPFELANGVATVRKTISGNYVTYNMVLVSQAGAVSVANAEGGAIPEEVEIYLTTGNPPSPFLVKQSNLVQLGATVLTWDSDYSQMALLLKSAVDEFTKGVSEPDRWFDLEYKKVAPEGLLRIKQIRELPLPDTTPSVTPFLVNEPVEYTLYQGEQNAPEGLFAYHRLKSRWRFQTQTLRLTEANLQKSFYKSVEFEYVDGAGTRLQRGQPATWLNAVHKATKPSPAGTLWDIADSWDLPVYGNPRNYSLGITNLQTRLPRAECPLLALRDLNSGWYSGGEIDLTVTYRNGVKCWDNSGVPFFVTEERARLEPRRSPQIGDLPQKRACKFPEGHIVRVHYYWPPVPDGPIAGYTAPLARWGETTIEGFTAKPIVLHGDYSQTYCPSHHNFAENFLFEPRLEPGIDPEILSELRARDIRLFHYTTSPWATEDPDGQTLRTYGFDPDEPPTRNQGVWLLK